MHLSKHSNTHTHTHSYTCLYKCKTKTSYSHIHTHTHPCPAAALSCRANAAKFMILFHACFSLTFSFVAAPCLLSPCHCLPKIITSFCCCYSPVAPASALPLPLVNLFQVAFWQFFLCFFSTLFFSTNFCAQTADSVQGRLSGVGGVAVAARGVTAAP